MTPTDFAVILALSSVCLAVLAVALYLLIPSIREKEKQAGFMSSAPLEVRYAKELASGAAVIISADKNASRKITLYLVLAGLAMLAITKIRHYIEDLGVTCTPLWGLNSFFVNMVLLQCAGFVFVTVLLWTGYRGYKEAVKDGYSPPRNSKGFTVDKIAFKLTPKIKLKLQLQLGVQVVAAIFYLSVPMMITMTLSNSSVHDWNSLKNTNTWMQDSCLLELKTQHGQ